jgi:hypothetical protein
MATGDDAIAAGMANVNGATAPANTIDTEIMLTRDYIAQGRGATDSATASKVVKRDAAGRAKFASPSAAADAATKGYVDAAVAGVDVSWSGITGKPTSFPNADVTAADTSATPNTLVRRNADGLANFQAPVFSGNAANKGYVDTAVAGRAAASHTHSASDITSGTLSRPVSTSGSGRFGAAWDNNITGTRRAAWIEADGTLGHTASARKFKQDIRPAELTFEQLRAIPVVLYRYRQQVAAEKAGKIDHAATEIGTLADDLHDLGLWQFVIYDNDGAPLSVHYELLALAALSLGQQLADLLAALDARLTTIEQERTS